MFSSRPDRRPFLPMQPEKHDGFERRIQTAEANGVAQLGTRPGRVSHFRQGVGVTY
jgi:hypothetical protein